MHLGLQVTTFTYPDRPRQIGDMFGLIAERAERAGLYSLWVMDHFFQIAPVGPVTNEMLEGWSALAFAAGRTNHIKLGTMVTGVTYRHPGTLAKTATTLDVLSHGRAYLGIGAAWNEEEHRGLGVPFPPLKERFGCLEETLQIVHQMWRGDETPFHGQHYTLERPLSSPRPVQRPHPPILIGGMGEKKTLRLVAQYGDACNLFRLDRDGMAHKLDILREHCADLNRPYGEIEKTTLDDFPLTRDGRNGSLSPGAAIDMFGSLAELGIDQAIFSLHNVADLEPFEVLSEIIPTVEKMSVAGR